MIVLYTLAASLALLLFIKRSDIVAFYAKYCYMKGNVKRSVQIYKFAYKIGPLAFDSMMSYGYLLLRTGNLDDARKMLNLASFKAKKDTDKKRIKSILALVAWKDGHIDDAIEMLEEVISDFKTTTCYQNLGLMYVLKGDAENALRFNQEAYEYNSDDLVIADNYAESLALCGKIDEAKTIYEKILYKEPHFPEAYYGYGLLLYENGEREKGIDLIRQSLDKRFSYLSVKTKEEVESLLSEKIGR